MTDQDAWREALTRLRPLLEPIFSAYGISPQQAQEIVEEACLVLISKHPRHPDPEGWLLRSVIDRCEKLRQKKPESPPEGSKA